MADTKISALTAATTPLAGTEVLPIVQSGVTKQVSVANLTAGRTVDMAFLNVAGTAGKIGNINTTNANGGYATWQTNGTSIWDIGSAKQCFGTGTANDGGLVSRAGYYFGLGANGSEIIRLTTDGNATVVQAAKGINFTANTPAAGMTSQLLNWYEEGTWTPTLTTSGTGFTSVSYFPGAVVGRYTRVGNLVTVQGSMRTTAITVGSASGNLRIGGLPFTAANVAFSDSCVSVAAVSGFNTNQPSGGRVVGNTTQIELEYRAAANGATSVMGFAEANTGYNVNIINFSATYRV